MLKRTKAMLDLDPEHFPEQRDLNRETALLFFSRCMRVSGIIVYPNYNPSRLSRIIGHFKKGNNAETLVKMPAPVLGSEDEVQEEIQPLTFRWHKSILGVEVHEEVNELRKSASTTEGDRILDVVQRAEKCSSDYMQAAQFIARILVDYSGMDSAESEGSED
jgi:hypothetical protein